MKKLSLTEDQLITLLGLIDVKLEKLNRIENPSEDVAFFIKARIVELETIALYMDSILKEEIK